VAASEVHDLDARRKPLAMVNPLFAKVSELPPVPQVEDITFEHISLNLPVIAKNALEKLELDKNIQEKVAEDSLEKSEEVEEPVNEALEEGNSEESKDEPYVYDEEELNELDDETLLDICNELDIEFEDDNVERNKVIQAILDAQNGDNE
jgi:hypothetical protein